MHKPVSSFEDTPFVSALLQWYEENGRSLPWRGLSDPYLIWLSEIILQQTRVEQGRDYYLRFSKAFPAVEDLARASEDEVMKLWQGLGYYSRARNLHRAARMVVEEMDGRFPRSYDSLLRLPGVGRYTAAAVASFAFGLPYAAVDGNVYRVLGRYFGIDLPIDTTEGRKYFASLSGALLPPRRSADYNQAMMDFGSLCCTPARPGCDACPLAVGCIARSEGRVTELPRKKRHIALRSRYFTYLIFESSKGFLLRRRPDGDIWAGLYEPPMIESESPLTKEEALRVPWLRSFSSSSPVLSSGATIKHVLTHRIIYADAYLLRSSETLPFIEGFEIVSHEEIARRAMPKLLSDIFSRFHILF